MFNRSFAKKHIKMGDLVTLTGKWDAHRLQITVNHYKKGTADQQAEIQPIYSIKGEIKMGRLKKVIYNAIKEYDLQVTELLPETYLISYKLPERMDAVKTLHYPENRQTLKHARRRFVYEEFLIFQLRMQLLKKWHREATEGNAQHYEPAKLQSFIDSFPFTLTAAQSKSLNQILADMKSPYRMNRLLQGDVGSGKTAVAAICLYASITANRQGALMVPTEILAEQHYQSLKELFGEQANIALLTGSVKGKKRKEIIAAIENHEIQIVIGTHALIQDDVFFDDLGLANVDEQNRFGVKQGRKLGEKGMRL